METSGAVGVQRGRRIERRRRGGCCEEMTVIWLCRDSRLDIRGEDNEADDGATCRQGSRARGRWWARGRGEVWLQQLGLARVCFSDVGSLKYYYGFIYESNDIGF
ncbi:hypothetical protein TRIUR3_05082 [Triticum urartu]|uniref:Uncharacterized protein n=1 Tax=Triticum urartu TaxID=4572 RepID=M8A326_TRIUA|nr:hypothetical protein TRIUR3_05082 [Triticum urartu]